MKALGDDTILFLGRWMFRFSLPHRRGGEPPHLIKAVAAGHQVLKHLGGLFQSTSEGYQSRVYIKSSTD